MQVTIYSDGGADPNPGYGGWAAILRFGAVEKELSGSAPDVTNNQMELTAAIEALRALKRPCTVAFYTDSEYVRRGITEWIDSWVANNWQRGGGKPIPNAELWQALAVETARHTIEWHWVRGHAGNRLNERVDELARAARLAITPGLDLAADVPRLYLRASCRGNPGPGGWGAVLLFDDVTQQHSGSERATTNNRMELLAALEGLTLLPPGSQAQVFTTSDYVFQGVTRWIVGWRRRAWQKKDAQPIANADLWQALDAQAGRYRLHWVNAKGQSDEALETAGKLAAQAARSA